MTIDFPELVTTHLTSHFPNVPGCFLKKWLVYTVKKKLLYITELFSKDPTSGRSFTGILICIFVWYCIDAGIDPKTPESEISCRLHRFQVCSLYFDRYFRNGFWCVPFSCFSTFLSKPQYPHACCGSLGNSFYYEHLRAHQMILDSRDWSGQTGRDRKDDAFWSLAVILCDA